MKKLLLLSFLVSTAFSNIIEVQVTMVSNEVNETAIIEEYKMGQVSNIYYDYDEALSLAREEKKNLFILFQRADCPWCIKLQNTTLQDEALTEQLNEDYVVLILDRDKSLTYPKTYNVMGVPSVYLVDSNEKIHVIEQGYSEDPKNYIELLDICTQRTKAE